MKKLAIALVLMLLAMPVFAQEGVVKWNAIPKTVAIVSSMGLGTGCIVTEDGYIVTNKHVVNRATFLKVYDSKFNEYGGRIVGYHSECDIAVIKILPTEKLEYFDAEKMVANPNQIFIMDEVYTIGHPLGSGWTITKGIVSNKLQNEKGIRYFQIDASINQGNSGGALVNKFGKLIGINSMAIPPMWAENMAYAIAVGSLIEEVTMLIEEDVERVETIKDIREYKNSKATSYYKRYHNEYRGYGY